MRVTVQIDSDDQRPVPSVRTGAEERTAGPVTAGGVATDAGAPASATSPAGQLAVPAELEARAARVGALSAGPAPTGPPAVAGEPGFLPESLTVAAPSQALTTATGPVDAATSAGAAPGHLFPAPSSAPNEERP